MGKAAGVASLQTGIMLRVVDSEEQFPLVGEMRIGRESDCDIRIEDRLVSRYHLAIRVGESAVYAQDLMSTNGTYLNGKRLIEVQRLEDGDELRISDHLFRVVGVPAYSAAAEVGTHLAAATTRRIQNTPGQPQQSRLPASRDSDVDSPVPVNDVPVQEKGLAAMGKSKLSAIERQILKERDNGQGA